MKEINIARAIVSKRKEKGVTQNELANYIGVSKASVSKWETEQSYPDITFLPQLATYFNISIDELMGYEPQMTKKDIRNLYLKISKDFAEKPFDEVITHCREIIKKYFSCYPLLYQIGVLFINNSSLANDKDKNIDIITEAKELFEKIRKESDDVELAKQSICMEAVSLISLGKPKEVIDLLGESNSFVMSTEILLASAYQMTGKIDEAKRTLQIEIYQYFLTLFQLLQFYLSLCTDDEKLFDEISKRAWSIADVFHLEELHPSILLPFYLIAAQGNLVNGNTDKAIKCLESYTRIATGDIYPLKLKGDNFFNLIDAWFENFPIGTNLPRDEKIIKRSMLEAVINNPAFVTLTEDIRFKNIILKLKNNC
jgi:transcriptional regulator with XRE-family HTH domain